MEWHSNAFKFHKATQSCQQNFVNVDYYFISVMENTSAGTEFGFMICHSHVNTSQYDFVFITKSSPKKKRRKKSGYKIWRYKPTSVFCLLNVVKHIFLWLFVVCQFAISWKWENILEKVVRFYIVRYFLRSAPVFIS